MGRYELHDDQWERIRDIVPGKQGDRGRTATDNRAFVDGVLWVSAVGRSGRTCRSATGTGRAPTSASLPGPRPGCGSRCSRRSAAASLGRSVQSQERSTRVQAGIEVWIHEVHREQLLDGRVAGEGQPERGGPMNLRYRVGERTAKSVDS